MYVSRVSASYTVVDWDVRWLVEDDAGVDGEGDEGISARIDSKNAARWLLLMSHDRAVPAKAWIIGSVENPVAQAL